jgi:hypothetical protein
VTNESRDTQSSQAGATAASHAVANESRVKATTESSSSSEIRAILHGSSCIVSWYHNAATTNESSCDTATMESDGLCAREALLHAVTIRGTFITKSRDESSCMDAKTMDETAAPPPG